MENIDEFREWMKRMLADAKGKLNLSDITIAFLLSEYALEHCTKCLLRKQRNQSAPVYPQVFRGNKK